MIFTIRGKVQEFHHVFLDLDGTITESGPGIMHAAQHMLDRIGMREDDEERLRGFNGPPVLQYLREAYGFSEEEAQQSYAVFREYYDSRGMFESRLYDGIVEAIEYIRRAGKRVYVATAKPELLALPILKHFHVLGLFDRVFAVRREIGICDKRQVLQYAAAELGRIPGPVMVGDRCYDIEGGRAVGYATAGVLYGYGTKKELLSAGCDYLLENVSDLAGLCGGMDEGIVCRV